ncbi:MAG TPA: NUDIX domain-containing protein [Patescibacteria group bacterium]
MKTRVRAIIFIESGVVLIHRIKKGNEYWVFPGGGVEEGEDNIKALIRECKEELGVVVNVNEMFCEVPFGDDQLELFFKCQIASGTLGTGDGPEFKEGTLYEGEYSLEIIPFDALCNFNILPEMVRDKLIKGGR